MKRNESPREDQGFNSRNLALGTLLKIESEAGYANLVLPAELRKASLEPRDSAFVTELVYGTLRKRDLYDRIIETAAKRPIRKIDDVPLNILRLTAHQLLTMQTPPHAAVDSAVRLTVRNRSGSASGFVNAISRRISERKLSEWLEMLSENLDSIEHLALEYSHPRWIIQKYYESLKDWQLVVRELQANNQNPRTTAVIYSGNRWSEKTLETSQSCEWSEDCRYIDGNPESVSEIRNATGGVQDQGSYLVARALSLVPASIDPAKKESEIWLDLCAGPGGKAALLSRWAEKVQANFLAQEIAPHRAELVTRMTKKVVIADSALPPIRPASVTKILLDAPCSGLGALRRRPDARHRKKEADLQDLVILQRQLLMSAVDLLAEGGVLAYVTCSPVREETSFNSQWLLEQKPEVTLIDARAFFPQAMTLGDTFDVQLWPGLHHTDAMYLALFRKVSARNQGLNDRITQ